MQYLLLKYLVTAGIVVLVSEVARRNDSYGALIAALPLVTILTLLWLHFEGQPPIKIANHAWFTFWYVLPSLPMFLLFPVMQPRFGFWPSLVSSVLGTAFLIYLVNVIINKFN